MNPRLAALPMTPAVRFMLADNHPIVCQGLRMILTQIAEYSVVGETGDGAAVVELAMRLDPDVVLLDITLPSRSSLQILAEFDEKKLRARVIMLSDEDSESSVVQSLQLGARGYLLKSVTAAELHLAIATVLRGYRYVSVDLADRILTFYLSVCATSAKLGVPKAAEKVNEITNETSLTFRQREVLRLMASGHDNIQISDMLEISPRTVETHRAKVMQKLGLTTAYAVFRYALQRGLISPEE